MPSDATFCPSRCRASTIFAALALLLLCSVAAGQGPSAADRPSPRVIVLDNRDSDFRNPPFDDGISVLDAKGSLISEIGGLNICQNIGGNRAISVSPDGGWFVVCENVGQCMTAYETGTGKVLWSLPGGFKTAIVAGDTIYALTAKGTIYGDGAVAVSADGKVITKSATNGFDLVADPNGSFLWLVGGDIKKCDTNLNVVVSLDPITWCAVSADVNPDGSVWVAERRHPDVNGSQNRLLKISPQGGIRKTIPLGDLTPLCVRVDRSDGSFWVTGIAVRKGVPLPSGWNWPIRWRRRYKYIGPRTHKYSAQGKLLVKMKKGGKSLDLDPTDGSVWVADESGLLHYTRDGKVLGTSRGFSADSKWIAVVPGTKEGGRQSR